MDSEVLRADLKRLQDDILPQAKRRLDQAEQFGIAGDSFDDLRAGTRRASELHTKWEDLPAKVDHMLAAFDGHLLESVSAQVDEAYYEVHHALGIVDADLFTVKKLIEQAEYDEPIWKEIKEQLSSLEPEMEEAKSVVSAAQDINAQEASIALKAMEDKCPLIPEVATLSELLADRDDGQDGEAAVVARAKLRQIEGDIPGFRYIINQLRELVQREGAPAEDAQGE